MRILVATDAWHPQVNGVVHSLQATAQAVEKLGAEVEFLTPQGFCTLPLPSYPEIRLALLHSGMAGARIEAIDPDHIHIATEGPIGLAVRRACLDTGRRFTTSYHTRYPEYISARWPLPESWSYGWLRRFHNAGAGLMVSTASIAAELESRGFKRLMRWSRGVDHGVFFPREGAALDLPRPIFLYAGRVAVEKNIEAFLELDLPGTKLVAGDGPARKALAEKYPQVHFAGMQNAEGLATLYSGADVFVFPSRTDTFGIVLLEAMACGLPVAAYPVPGPLDVIGASGAGVLDGDLRAACLAALAIPRATALAHAQTFTWEASGQQFIDNVRQARGAPPLRASGKKRDLVADRQGVDG